MVKWTFLTVQCNGVQCKFPALLACVQDLENDARLLNLKLLTPLWEKRGDTCPFRKGCEPSGNPPVPDECKIFYRYDVDPLVEVPGMS